MEWFIVFPVCNKRTWSIKLIFNLRFPRFYMVCMFMLLKIFWDIWLISPDLENGCKFCKTSFDFQFLLTYSFILKYFQCITDILGFIFILFWYLLMNILLRGVIPDHCSNTHVPGTNGLNILGCITLTTRLASFLPGGW